MDADHASFQSKSKFGIVVRVVHARAFKIDVKLNEKGFSEGVLAFHGVHGGKEKAKRSFDLFIVRSTLDVLDKHSGRNV